VPRTDRTMLPELFEELCELDTSGSRACPGTDSRIERLRVARVEHGDGVLHSLTRQAVLVPQRRSPGRFRGETDRL
jgi:hypothetical protein